MPKTLVHQNLGGPGTPQEVKDLRKSSFDLHEELGFPVIVKHRWNEIDLKEGRTRLCPYHDELYDRSPSNCPYCFGTGYLGGFADGAIVYVTLQDAAQDVIRVTPQGILQMDQNPALTAPWIPELGDGDLVILATFEGGNWDVDDVHERYLLRMVEPITMRGPGWNNRNSTTSKRFRISQQSAADKVPLGHEFYNVPIVFNYDDVPPDVTPPDDPDLPEGYTYSAHEVSVRVVGAEDTARTSFREQEVRVAVAGDPTSREQAVRVTGKTAGTVIVDL